MQGQIMARVQLAVAGAIGGLLLWSVIQAMDHDWVTEQTGLVLVGFVLTLSGGTLAMAGPLGLARAVPRALGLALVAAGLTALGMLRYADTADFLHNPLQLLAALVVAILPVPFLIAQGLSGWRDYPALFLQAWSVVLRFAAAGAFTGLFWLVIQLSDAVLSLVGVDVIGELLRHELVPILLTGALLGLGMAVVHDLADLLSPYVVLRLFRLFLPAMLAVMLVFLIALPIRGLDGLAGGLSPALLLLAMVAGGIALVSITIDQSDADATDSPLLLRSARGMALALPLFAALALWAIWLRVAEYGWTPERIFVGLIGAVGLGYGGLYAVAVLRGGPWMERIRQGNIRMALVVIALAALWLTPILNAERLSVASQMARFNSGALPVEKLDIAALSSWGKPGEAALAALKLRAAEPGQETLARILAGEPAEEPAEREALVERLKGAIPVQPASATGTRDSLFLAASEYQLLDWLAVCELASDEGGAACLMVVGDLMPLVPGEEALIFLDHSGDYIQITGLFIDAAGTLQSRNVGHPDGSPIATSEAAALLRQYRTAPPPVTPALLNQMGAGETGLLILP